MNEELYLAAAQLAEHLERSAIRRYRPINADDDVIEMSGRAFDQARRFAAEMVAAGYAEEAAA